MKIARKAAVVVATAMLSVGLLGDFRAGTRRLSWSYSVRR